MERDGVGTSSDRLLHRARHALVVFVGADDSRPVDVDDVAAAVFVGVNTTRDALLGEDGVCAAAGDPVDGPLEILESGDGSDRDTVVHGDDQVATVCGNAFESCAESCGHSCCVTLCQWRAM